MIARAFFALATCTLAGCAIADRSASARLNVVLIITDDQGYGDYGFRRNPVLETPSIDALAAQCPDVRRFYVSPVCSPTRACLMTGRYNYRTRVVDTWIGRSMLEPAEVTIAEALRDAGYSTGIFGKWHLGDAYPLRPNDQGFDESLVHRGGGLAQPSEPPANDRRYTDALLFRNGEQVATRGYCTDVYFDAAIEFIDACQAKGRPFFSYVATNAPHGPFHDVPRELYEKYRVRDLTSVQQRAGLDLDVVARTYAMIENIDQNIGRLLAHLDARGLTEDTLVVLLGDNGPVAGRYNAGLRGGKGSVYDGGIRSPLLVRWPGQLQPRTVVTEVAAHIDVMPTILDALAIDSDVAFDGRSLWPLLTGQRVAWPARQLVLQSHRGDVPVAEHHFAILGRRWKLLRASGFGRQTSPDDVAFELYDLLRDPGEQHDVAETSPEVVAQLRDAYRDWYARVSTTRPDNYAPPRIVPGTKHEPVTTLTHQDWRVSNGERSWGEHGEWRLHFVEACTLGVRVLCREPREMQSASIHIGDTVIEIDRSSRSDVVDLGRVYFPPGDVDFSIVCRHPTGNFAPYQVQLVAN